MQLTALIPAYNPTTQLVVLVRQLAAEKFVEIVVVDDGSLDSCAPIFQDVAALDKVTLLRHAVNLGKGAALKTGLNHVYCRFRESCGVVAVDADGQHLVEDACRVANMLQAHPHSLVIGVRSFDRNVPLRSRLGNRLTGLIFRLLNGICLADTQSGLRGIPRDLIPALLRIRSNGYEYELDMLMACKYSKTKIIQQPIQTVYIDNNKSSHFNPIIDSMKIYFVLFRFSFTSLMSAFIDNLVFMIAYGLSCNIFTSQVVSRVIATTFNYMTVRRIVFYSKERVIRTLPKYLTLVVFSGLVSYLLITILSMHYAVNVIAAKIIAETLIFLANFAIQRDFIFAARDDTSVDNRQHLT